MVGINPLFANAMHLVMAQRLVRRLDDSTKIPYKPDDHLKDQIQAVVDSLPPHMQKPNLTELTLYKPGRSEVNPFGYGGQLALREQLQMTSGVQAILRLPANQVSTEMLQAKAVEEGMRTMLQDGVLKVIAGLTSIEEVYRVVG
jgi:general secretion pathway protein E